jgi:DNA (cytosine-5)-methyltransferase 1
LTQLESCLEILEAVYEEALASYELEVPVPGITDVEERHLATVLRNQEKRKAAVAVLVTLLLKKLLNPDQDIRLHRAEFDGGFSGRRLDTKVVTPFLRSKEFPSMSESGWLTRSFEQSHPFDFNYPGNITPKALKQSLLQLFDAVQRQGQIIAERFLLRLFIGLVETRDKNRNLKLARPVNLSIAEVVDILRRHHQGKAAGAARLPVLAIHAILSVLATETERYRDCKLLPLESHTAADSRSHLIGDINILGADNKIFEGYEIKHNVPITSELIETSFDKLRTTPVQRFYILATYPRDDYGAFNEDIQRVAQTHGCQLIVNGVDRTILYYLRIIGSTRSFIDAYVTLLESDEDINFQLKESWNQIVSSN